MNSSLGDDGPRSVSAVQQYCDKRGLTLVRFVVQSTVLGNETQVRGIRAAMTAPRAFSTSLSALSTSLSALSTSLRSPLSRSIPI
jgi:hypothetical protein